MITCKQSLTYPFWRESIEAYEWTQAVRLKLGFCTCLAACVLTVLHYFLANPTSPCILPYQTPLLRYIKQIIMLICSQCTLCSQKKSPNNCSHQEQILQDMSQIQEEEWWDSGAEEYDVHNQVQDQQVQHPTTLPLKICRKNGEEWFRCPYDKSHEGKVTGDCQRMWTHIIKCRVKMNNIY